MSNHDLSKIEEPWFPTDDQRHAWLCHLAYGQFHIDEFKNGGRGRFIGIKEIDSQECDSSVNKFPVNDVTYQPLCVHIQLYCDISIV
mgnify:CR=1 FL=1